MLIRLTTTRPALVAAAFLTLAAIVMTQFPLVNDLGFEFAMALTPLAACTAGFMAIALLTGKQGLSLRENHGPGRVFVLIEGTCLATLIPPLAVITVKSAASGFCNPLEGVWFYLLLPGITALLASSTGIFCALASTRPRLLFVGLLFALLGVGVYRLLSQPAVFAYNPLIGYFPGPIYDEIVRITPTLLAARAMDFTAAVAVLCGGYTLVEPVTWSLRPRRLLQRFDWPQEAGASLARVVCVLCCAVVCVAWFYRAPLGIAIDRAYIVKTLGGHKQTAHFDLYYDLNANTARHIELVALDHEYQLSRLTDFLKIAPPQGRIRSFIYATPEQKKRLMGAEDTSLERPGDDEMHLNDEPFPHPVLKHELAHVLASAFGNGLYGGSYKMGFHEGMAVAADWDEGRLTAHQWSRAIRVLGLAPPMEQLTGTFGFWTAAPSRAYTLCGSFVRFLIDRYGVDRFKKAFPDGDVASAYRQPLPALVQQWEAFVDSIPLSDAELRVARQVFQTPSIFERTCPHEAAILTHEALRAYGEQRYQSAIRLFEQVDSAQPGATPTLRGLLFSTYYARNYAYTDSLATAILRSPNPPVGLKVDALLILGDLAWKRDERIVAQERYRSALGQHASERTEREALVKLAVLDRPGIRRLIRDFLLADPDEGYKIRLVGAALRIDPEFAVGHYLVGRRLFQEESYRGAIPYFIRAYSLTLSDPLLREENLRLLGLCYFYEKNYDHASEVFKQIAGSADSSAKRTRMQEWVERCQWFAGR